QLSAEACHYSIVIFFFNGSGDHPDLHSFPTRRSSDLWQSGGKKRNFPDLKLLLETENSNMAQVTRSPKQYDVCIIGSGANDADIDRKSTRLNSSHVAISYAVFCLKKKNHLY